MYPRGELIDLTGRKIALRRRIHERRRQLTADATAASRPVRWVDEVRARWREISPYTKAAAVPLAFLLKRTVFGRSRLLGLALRWAPLAFTLYKQSRPKT